MPTPTLYYTPGSVNSRTVLLAAKALNLNLNLKFIDITKGEQLTPEFLKMNPQHVIPTLVDDGFVVWESRAIMQYLADKYGRGNNLYPKDLKARALVDQRIYFDISTLVPAFNAYFTQTVMLGAAAPPDIITKVEDTFKHLDTFLEGEKYAAGPNLTLADLCLVVTVSSFEATDFDFQIYPNVQRWYKTIKTMAPGYKEINEKGMELFNIFVNHLKSGENK